MERLKNLIPLNFALLSNPVNWAVIVLMVLLAGIGLALIMNATTISPSNSEN